MTNVVTMKAESHQQLVKYDEMCRAISEAYVVDEVKDLRDKAMAIEMYQRQANNTEAERQACEIRLRAERRCGELLRQREKAKGNQHVNSATSNSAREQKTLSDLNISWDQSSKWQKLADIPEEQFEEALHSDAKPTTSGILRGAQSNETTEQNVVPVSSDAIWLCGRLRDFERDGLLSKAPAAVMSTMTVWMRAECERLAPLVAAWLKGIGND